MNLLAKDKMKLSQAVFGAGLGGRSDLLLERISGLGCAALADYLDADRTPISLAIPTTERVPMICGISPQLGPAKFRLRLQGNEGEPTEKSKESEKSRTVTQTVTWKIDAAEINKAFAQGHVQALVVYPFLHKEQNEPQFEVDGQFSLFFSSSDSSSDIKLRTGPMDVLHIAQLGTNKGIMDSAIDPATGVIRVKLPRGNPTMKTLSSGIAETQEDAVCMVPLSLEGGSGLASSLNDDGREFLKITYTWKQTRADKDQPWTPSIQTLMQTDVSGNSGVTVEASCGLPALKADGTVDPEFTTGLSQKIRNPNWPKQIKLNAAVWLRVVNKTDNKVVDLVPACLNDDSVQNSINDPLIPLDIQERLAGKPYPLMRFDLGINLNFNVAELLKFAGDDGVVPDMKADPEAVMIADPRFNYAPEPSGSERYA